MERRNALKNVIFSAAGIITLPIWGNNWNIHTLPNAQNIFTNAQEQSLDILVDALIPSSTIPGAKDLGIPAFINKMLTDCYEKPNQENFKLGLENADKLANEIFGKELSNCDTIQKNELLKKLSTSTDTQQLAFFTLLKSLTVLAYTTSEYVMTKHLHYIQAPGHYYGCVNV